MKKKPARTQNNIATATPCRILWTETDVKLTPQDWRARFARCKRAPLTQSYDYALAVCPLYGQKARWGVIEIDGEEAGLLQIQEAGLLKNLIHGVILDRGPIWYEGFGSAEHQKAFFEHFARLFPARFGRRRRVIPEIDKSADNGKTDWAHFFKTLGYTDSGHPGYKTIWLDLTKDEETLRAALHKKWRNALNKAAQSGLEITWDETGITLPWLLDVYQKDKEEKNYDGPSAPLLRALYRNFFPHGAFIIGQARIENIPVAAILILCHGQAATYQIGWINEQGKEVAAHNLLLWQAITMLKSKDVRDFDLGGINDKDAKGLQKFKSRMGGKTVILPGTYR